MKTKVLAFFLILATVSLVCGVILLPSGLKIFITSQISKTLGGKTNIQTLKIVSPARIQLFNLTVTKKNLYSISIGAADLKSKSFLTFSNGTPINCLLSDFKISHKDLALISGIASLLSMQPLESVDFKNVSFEFLAKDKQVIFKNLDARSDNIKIFANGTIGKADNINYSVKLFLSKTLTDQIPEKVKELLFKENEGWSEIDLYISGTTKKPLINLATQLFKLILH